MTPAVTATPKGEESAGHNSIIDIMSPQHADNLRPSYAHTWSASVPPEDLLTSAVSDARNSNKQAQKYDASKYDVSRVHVTTFDVATAPLESGFARQGSCTHFNQYPGVAA